MAYGNQRIIHGGSACPHRRPPVNGSNWWVDSAPGEAPLGKARAGSDRTALLLHSLCAGGKLLGPVKCQPSGGQGAGGCPSGPWPSPCCCGGGPIRSEIRPTRWRRNLAGPSSAARKTPGQRGLPAAGSLCWEPHHPLHARPMTGLDLPCRVLLPQRGSTLSLSALKKTSALGRGSALAL